ncbi:OmpA family protein [Telmatospirillum sp. J64-1]|uniref:OmpA family protein n=1 Tax=Telmatospirillum sp. J64-1 TaxID=2502183 RepID=UPI00115DB53F|nr:OmpA family protein [Telmatospirillum sp. J64-1]
MWQFGRGQHRHQALTGLACTALSTLLLSACAAFDAPAPAEPPPPAPRAVLFEAPVALLPQRPEVLREEAVHLAAAQPDQGEDELAAAVARVAAASAPATQTASAEPPPPDRALAPSHLVARGIAPVTEDVYRRRLAETDLDAAMHQAALGNEARPQGRTSPNAEAAPLSKVTSITFLRGSSRLGGKDTERLKAVANLYHEQEGRVVRIIGHGGGETGGRDPVERMLGDFELSLLRANAVAEVLAGFGVPASAMRIEASAPGGVGEAPGRVAEIFIDY